MEAEDLEISGEDNLVITEDDEGLGDAQAPSAKIGGAASPPPDADGAVANDDKFDARTLMSLYTTLQSELAATRRQVIDLETALQQKQAALVAREAAFEKQSQLIADLSSDIGQLKAAKQTKKQIKKDVAKDVNELKLSLALVESENRRLRGIGDEVQNVKREWKAIHDAQQKELNRVRSPLSLSLLLSSVPDYSRWLCYVRWPRAWKSWRECTLAVMKVPLVCVCVCVSCVVRRVRCGVWCVVMLTLACPRSCKAEAKGKRTAKEGRSGGIRRRSRRGGGRSSGRRDEGLAQRDSAECSLAGQGSTEAGAGQGVAEEDSEAEIARDLDRCQRIDQTHSATASGEGRIAGQARKASKGGGRGRTR